MMTFPNLLDQSDTRTDARDAERDEQEHKKRETGKTKSVSNNKEEQTFIWATVGRTLTERRLSLILLFTADYSTAYRHAAAVLLLGLVLHLRPPHNWMHGELRTANLHTYLHTLSPSPHT